MTKYNCVDTLCRAGISHDDAIALRRISMTLHRWHELECGDSDDYKSYCLVRGKKPPRVSYRDPESQAMQWKDGGDFVYADDGAPYMETHYHRGEAKATYYRVNDREAGALKRLKAIMTRYPGFASYVQGDPRGAALYIMRPGDVREGLTVDCCYTNGIAVCQ